MNNYSINTHVRNTVTYPIPNTISLPPQSTCLNYIIVSNPLPSFIVFLATYVFLNNVTFFCLFLEH